MHLLIPHAYGHDDECRQAFHHIALPALRQLLARLRPEPADEGDEWTLSPPHERAQARSLGLPIADGLIPWAAWRAAQAPAHLGAADACNGVWGYLSPCHWQVGMDHLTMSGPYLPELSEAESRALLDTLAAFMQQDGITLHFDRPDHWLVRGELLRDLPSASLDRVLGQNLAPWITRQGGGAPWRRLHSELQMLLYAHPVNDQREARGQPTINSVWLHGTGSLPDRAGHVMQTDPTLTVAEQLRDSAVAQDWPAWGCAWQAMDATLCADLLAQVKHGAPGRLTLCGQRRAVAWVAPPPSLAQRIKTLFGGAPDLRPLEQL
ncbi:phosphoglycerate mutase [Rhodoferax sp.]|uniref:phosphoglycerate mutase n=1 Tax=Rhodoferax sp. TaxID=50421 RepID=UPI0027599FB7|nr:phosphoglycerate mutase [Rhodoferax sp.]